MSTRHILTVTAVGLAAQLAMVVTGHYVPLIRDNVFAVGGMAISLAAGLAYAKSAATGWGAAVSMAAIIGGVCALLGIGVSAALGDVPLFVLAAGTLSSTVTGAIGGAVGKRLADRAGRQSATAV
jgi:hypothetical protein